MLAAASPKLADGTGRHNTESLLRELARREAKDAANERMRRVLARLVAALPERVRYEFSRDSLRLLNALSDAEALLAEVE